MLLRLPPTARYFATYPPKKEHSSFLRNILSAFKKQDATPSKARVYTCPATTLYTHLGLSVEKLHAEAKEWSNLLHINKLLDPNPPVYNLSLPLLRVFRHTNLHYAEVIDQSKRTYPNSTDQLHLQQQLILGWKSLLRPSASSLLRLIHTSIDLITEIDTHRHGSPKNNEFMCQFRIQNEPSTVKLHRDIGHEWVLRLPLSVPSFKCSLNIHETSKLTPSKSIPFSDIALINGETFHSVTMESPSFLGTLLQEPRPRIALFMGMLKAPTNPVKN